MMMVMMTEKKQGGGIVYRPPETLAEYLDCGLVLPVPGASTRNDGRRTFFGEVRNVGGGAIFDVRKSSWRVSKPILLMYFVVVMSLLSPRAASNQPPNQPTNQPTKSITQSLNQSINQ